MTGTHPFLKRPSVEVPAVRGYVPGASISATPVRGAGVAILAALGAAALVIAALAGRHAANTLPPVPVVLAAPTLAHPRPLLELASFDALPVIEAPAFYRASIAPSIRRTPLPTVEARPAKAADLTEHASQLPPSSAGAFADQVVAYKPASNGPLAVAAEVTASPTPYRVVSIVAADLVLVAMNVDGQTMVSPYRTGQSLPDGKRITSIDSAHRRVVTSDGVLASP